MKSADSSQFPWQRWAVPAHCGLLRSAELRPLPALLPHFPLSLLALLVFVYFFPLMLLWTVGLWSHRRPRSLFSCCYTSSSSSTAVPLLCSFSVPYFLLSFPSFPPSPSFLLCFFLQLPELLLRQLQLRSPFGFLKPKISHFLVSPCSLETMLPVEQLRKIQGMWIKGKIIAANCFCRGCWETRLWLWTVAVRGQYLYNF